MSRYSYQSGVRLAKQMYNYFQINKVYLDFKTIAALHFASTHDLKCVCVVTYLNLFITA